MKETYLLLIIAVSEIWITAAGCKCNQKDTSPQLKINASADFFTYYCNATLFVNGTEVATLNSGNISKRLTSDLRKGENNYEIKITAVTTKVGNGGIVNPRITLRFYKHEGDKVIFLTEELTFKPKEPITLKGVFWNNT